MKASPYGTTEEVAAYLRTTPATLRNMRWMGTAPKATKVGRKLLWKWSDVDAWLESNTSDSTGRVA